MGGASKGVDTLCHLNTDAHCGACAVLLAFTTAADEADDAESVAELGICSGAEGLFEPQGLGSAQLDMNQRGVGGVWVP